MTIRSSPCYLLMAVGGAGIAIISIAVLLTSLPTLLRDESPHKEASDRSWVAQANALVATLSNLDLTPINTATLEPPKDARLAEELLLEALVDNGNASTGTGRRAVIA